MMRGAEYRVSDPERVLPDAACASTDAEGAQPGVKSMLSEPETLPGTKRALLEGERRRTDAQRTLLEAERASPQATRGASASAQWQARLSLGFERYGARTILARRAHEGPLHVQKPLYPEGRDVCQCIIVHPPGGIADSDELRLDVEVGPGAHAQLTTPGAAKWYRSSGARASSHASFRIASRAILEWLPQGTIVFNGAFADSAYRVDCANDAAFFGWDVVCLGRTASAERFTQGQWRQRFEIRRDNVLIWNERAVLDTSAGVVASSVGLNGYAVFGTFVTMSYAVDTVFDRAALDACRALMPAQGDGTVTRLPSILVARYRGDSSEAAHAYFVAVWSLIRPLVTGRAATPPRIWRT